MTKPEKMPRAHVRSQNLTVGFVIVFLLVVLALAISGCGGAASSSSAGTGSGGVKASAPTSVTSYKPAATPPGTEIPSVSVTLGMRPYADNTLYVAGIKEGWFKDVGITITPQPYGLKTAENQWINLLLNGQVDINSATCGNMLATYKTTNQLKCAGFVDTFYGLVMLANPKLKLKTVADYVASGASFKDALRQALRPLSGKTVYVPTAAAARGFDQVPFKLAGLPLPNYQPLDDSQMLILAKSGRLDFANPSGAPIAATLLARGWTPVYDTGQLLKYGPGGKNSPLEPLVFNNGWAATASYINKHQATMLRFASVVFRTIHELQANPSLYSAYTPYLNSVAGTSLTPAGVAHTVATLDPFVSFESQVKYFDDRSSPEYYGNSMTALIQSLASSKTIPTGITASNIVWAAPMYRQLVAYKNRTEALFRKVSGQQLSSKRRHLLALAHQYYGWYDYLDAYRFANAAVG
jgi:ABC-type nitrate/sulfonate/bicarbonate transport system substrate-binding protein